MDRQLFKIPFREGSLPPWQCPKCGAGNLALVPKSFIKEEAAWSKRAHSHEAWEPEWIHYVYSCMLKCANAACAEVVVSVGTGAEDWEGGYGADGLPEQVWFTLFHPKYFVPHLTIIEIPEATPRNVSDELNHSFDLFFANPASAANHVRIALEHIMTDLKVKRFGTKKGRRYQLTLHSRVQLLPSKYDHLKGLCLAVKWLGNAGSHSNHEVTIDDVMDAYEIMEVVLSDLYDSKDIEKLAKQVNKKKGPRRKRKKG